MVPWKGERRTGGGEGDKRCLARQGELWDSALICGSAMLDWEVKEEEKRKKEKNGRALISSSRYCLPGPVCAADSSVGPIEAGGSTVHAADGAVQHIGCCTD
jgi:hypothetical protein